jgi:hypothetical protein
MRGAIVVIYKFNSTEIATHWKLISDLSVEYAGAGGDELLRLQLDLFNGSAIILVALDNNTVNTSGIEYNTDGNIEDSIEDNVKALLIGRHTRRGINDKGSMLIYLLTSFVPIKSSEWIELWSSFVDYLQKIGLERVELFTDNIAIAKIISNIAKHDKAGAMSKAVSKVEVKLFCSISIK